MAKNFKVGVVYTGGTFGCKPGLNGALEPCAIGDITAELQTLVKDDVQLVVHSTKTPIDSSAADPKNWVEISKEVDRFTRHTVNGVVVIHGTDSLAYTAAALAFLLVQWDMPVIVTGSQIPVFEKMTDARNNFIGSVEAALHYHRNPYPNRNLFGVFVYFNGKLMKGPNVVKTSSVDFDGFSSPRTEYVAVMKDGKFVFNFHLIDSIGINRNGTNRNGINRNGINRKRKLHTINNRLKVMIIKIYPGIDVSCYNYEGVDAIVVEALGSGNGPENVCNWLRNYANGNKRFVCVVSECLAGQTSKKYETSIAGKLEKCIGLANMTTPAALAKMYVCLSNPVFRKIYKNNIAYSYIRRAMSTSLAGELMYDSFEDHVEAGADARDSGDSGIGKPSSEHE